jgi:hypothetical protein
MDLDIGGLRFDGDRPAAMELDLPALVGRPEVELRTYVGRRGHGRLPTWQSATNESLRR